MDGANLLPPVKNKACVSLLKMLFTFYHSITGILVNLFLSLLKFTIQLSVLFLTSHEPVQSDIRICLMVIIVINFLSFTVSLKRFMSFYSTEGHANLNMSSYLEYDSLIGTINILIVLFYSLKWKDFKNSAQDPILIFNTLCYSIAFEQCLLMISSFFVFFYIIIASSMNRTKTSFFLKHDNHDTSKYSFCTICLENYQDDEFIMVLFCEHNFHYECVSIWLDINNSCPICKKDLEVPITLYEDKELQL